jgi:hypothetical protein
METATGWGLHIHGSVHVPEGSRDNWMGRLDRCLRDTLRHDEAAIAAENATRHPKHRFTSLRVEPKGNGWGYYIAKGFLPDEASQFGCNAFRRSHALCALVRQHRATLDAEHDPAAWDAIQDRYDLARYREDLVSRRVRAKGEAMKRRLRELNARAGTIQAVSAAKAHCRHHGACPSAPQKATAGAGRQRQLHCSDVDTPSRYGPDQTTLTDDAISVSTPLAANAARAAGRLRTVTLEPLEHLRAERMAAVGGFTTTHTARPATARDAKS